MFSSKPCLAGGDYGQQLLLGKNVKVIGTMVFRGSKGSQEALVCQGWLMGQDVGLTDVHAILAKQVELAFCDGYHWQRPAYQIISQEIGKRVFTGAGEQIRVLGVECTVECYPRGGVSERGAGDLTSRDSREYPLEAQQVLPAHLRLAAATLQIDGGVWRKRRPPVA